MCFFYGSTCETGIMPLHLSLGAMSLRLWPQDLIKGLHKPSFHHDHGTGHLIGCFPHRKQHNLLHGDTVKELSGDVEELLCTQESCVCQGGHGSHFTESCRRCSEDVRKHMLNMLQTIKDLTGERGARQACQRNTPPDDAVEVLEQLIAADLPVQLLAQLPHLEFETRKEVMNVCCAFLWPGIPHQIDRKFVEYLRDHSCVFQVLIEGYACEEAALHYGVVLRSCARHRELVEAFLRSKQIYELVKFARHPSIDISSDAFYTLREMFLEHKDISAAWLEENFHEFFKLYNSLLISGEYVAERQAQKLLAEILLDKHFRRVMLSYVSNERNLQITMNLLKDHSKSIQVEAFHVFKIFVANPQKPPWIQQILYKNREKLCILLSSLPHMRPEDKKLEGDVLNVMDKLRHLETPTSPSRAKA